MVSGMFVASASSWMVLVPTTTIVSRCSVADQVHGHLDGDLLALDDGDEVDVLERAADRVDLNLLGQRELRSALDVELEQGVGAGVLERHHRGVTRQGHVDRVLAVTVDDGGDLVVAADAAGSTLAELRTGLGLNLLGSHGGSPLV